MHAVRISFGAALAGAVLAAAACGGKTGVERAILEHNPGRYESISCRKDHTLELAGGPAVVYRCDAKPKGAEREEVCVVYRDGRLLDGPELEHVPLTEVFCEGQG